MLTNGETLTARKATLFGSRYDISVLPSGEIALDQARVEDVKKFRRADFVDESWRELDGKVAALDNPVDLFVKGVSRCHRWGMDAQSVTLLERLLAMQGSEQVPIIFGSESEEDIEGLWRIATGKAKASSGSGRPSAAVAIVNPAAGQSAGSDAERRVPPSSRASHRPPTPPARSGSGDASGLDGKLAEVHRLKTEAQVIYQRIVVGHRGDLKELHGARRKLESAVQILSSLPADEGSVRTMKRDVAGLLHAVIKSLPF